MCLDGTIKLDSLLPASSHLIFITKNLKEQCHEDFAALLKSFHLIFAKLISFDFHNQEFKGAVSRGFYCCAKIITLRL